MRSRWLLFTACGLGLALGASACGPQQKYCVSQHDVCREFAEGGAPEDDAGDQQMETGPIVLP